MICSGALLLLEWQLICLSFSIILAGLQNRRKHGSPFCKGTLLESLWRHWKKSQSSRPVIQYKCHNYSSSFKERKKSFHTFSLLRAACALCAPVTSQGGNSFPCFWPWPNRKLKLFVMCFLSFAVEVYTATFTLVETWLFQHWWHLTKPSSGTSVLTYLLLMAVESSGASVVWNVPSARGYTQDSG